MQQTNKLITTDQVIYQAQVIKYILIIQEQHYLMGKMLIMLQVQILQWLARLGII